MPLFSFSFREILPIQAPLVQTSTRPLTQPSLALSQESCSRPCTLARGFSSPGPRAGPRELIVLMHSSYSLIFQCPLSLVSDFRICWNTIGCSLCSSDQLGVSQVRRESGLCSHLSHCHLKNKSVFYFFLIQFWMIICFKKFIHFFHIVQLVSIQLFIIFSYNSLYACCVS